MYKTRKEYLEAQKISTANMRNEMGYLANLIMSNAPTILVILLITCIIVVTLAVTTAATEKRDEFYQSCLQEKKKYECDVLWSQIDAIDVGTILGAAAVGAVAAQGARR